MFESFIDSKEAPPLDGYSGDIVRQATQGYENAVYWLDLTKIEIVEQEMELVSEEYRFGGCPDAVGLDRENRLAILDWKTSSKGPYVDYLLQCAAYQILWEENHPDRPINGGFHLLRFSKENADFHHHYWSELDDAKEQFLGLRKAYDIDKKLKGRL